MGGIIKNSINKEKLWISDPQIDVRDRRILITPIDILKFMPNFPINDSSDSDRKQFDAENVQRYVRKWLVDVYETIFSDGFFHMSQNKLTEKQARAYIAKNMLYNIGGLVKDSTLQSKPQDLQRRKKLIKFINKQSTEILKFLGYKYPCKSKGALNKFNRIIKEFDEKDDKDSYDMLKDSEILFQKDKKDQYNTYSVQIMKVLNYFIKISNSQISNECNISYFESFQFIMKKIFDSTIKIDDIISNIEDNHEFNIQKYKQLMEKDVQNSVNRQQQVKFSINTKIDPQTEQFPSEKVQKGHFSVSNSSVLRVLQKWTLQLQDKLKNPIKHIKQRKGKFKGLAKGEQIELDEHQKEALVKAATNKYKEIQSYLKSLKDNFFQNQYDLSLQESEGKYINSQDTNLVIFAARIQVCIGEYIFKYADRLIRGLQQVVDNAAQDQVFLKKYTHVITQEAKIQQLKRVNLITFKVADLVRCQCTETQKNTIKIYQRLQSIGQKFPNLLKIIRVSNKLKEPTNDVILNIHFMGKLITQVRLSINSIEGEFKKEQDYHKINHLIYLLQRNEYGSIAQFAKIIASNDQCAQNYIQRYKTLPILQESYKKVLGELPDDNKNQDLLEDGEFENKDGTELPFVCKKCHHFRINRNYQFYSKNVNNKVCNKCYSEKKKKIMQKFKQQLFQKSLIIQDYKEQLVEFITVLQLYNPKQGEDIEEQGIIILQDQKIPTPRFYQRKIINEDPIYLTYKLTKYSQDSYINVEPIKQLQNLHKTHNVGQKAQILQKIFFFRIPKTIEVPSTLQERFICSKSVWFDLKTKHEVKFETRNGYKVVVPIPSTEQVERFKDEYLRKLIEELNLKKQKIINLECCQLKQITSKMSQVNILNIKNNQITNSEFLNETPALEQLYIDSNKDIKQLILKKQNNIKRLSTSCFYLFKVDCDNLKNISFDKLTKVTQINCQYCNVGSEYFEEIRTCSSLKILKYSKNKLTNQNLECLKYLKRLVTLQLDYCQIKCDDLSFLNENIDLKYLSVGNNNIKKLNGLEKLQNLESFDCNSNFEQDNDQNYVFSRKFQGQLLSLCPPSLKRLNCDNNSISTLQGINQQIVWINCNRNRIKHLQPLKGCQNIHTILCNYNQISKLHYLQNLTSLQIFSAQNNKIDTLMKGCNNLRILNINNLIQNNQRDKKGVSDLSSIKECYKLKILYLRNHNVKDLGYLAKLNHLESLNLEDNLIQNIDIIKDHDNFKELQKVFLQNNRLTDEAKNWIKQNRKQWKVQK